MNKKRWPTKKQWAQFFKVLNKKEKIAFLSFLLLFLVSFFALTVNIYYANTTTVSVKGGAHIEGVIGQPRFINPIYANSDADRDLTQLIFSGLVKYDKDLNIIADLAESFDISEGGRSYTFKLKENLQWEDEMPITANDVIFTIQTIQNPKYKSPFQANWIGVTVKKIDDLTVKFTLKKPYAIFLENCTIGILPQHIWKDIEPENAAFDSRNLKAVGSGPFKIEKVKERLGKILYISLEKNGHYHGNKPNISEVKFLFYESEDKLIKAAKKNKLTGISLTSSINIGEEWQNYSISLPRYFAVFFNQEKSEILKDDNVRLALNYATNKKEIVKEVLGNEDNRAIVNSPILPKIYGFESPQIIYDYDLEKAKQIIEEVKNTPKELAFSFKSYLQKGSESSEVTELQKCLDGRATGYFGEETEELVKEFQQKYNIEPLGVVGKQTRAKLNEICFEGSKKEIELKLTLITIDQPQMIKVANLLKKQWAEIGVELEVQQYPLFQLEQNFIKPRDYEMLLFGEVLSSIPDPFPFWHSSQRKDPGLNLAIYQNNQADKYLEENRQAISSNIRAENLNKFQNVLIEDIPVIFLYSPDFIYAVSKDLKGIEVEKITNPSKRFINIEDWFIKTKRAWK